MQSVTLKPEIFLFINNLGLVYPLTFYFSSLVSVNVFRNPFFILYLDRQCPVCLEKLHTDVGRVLPLSQALSLNPFCPRVHPCECGGIHEDPLLQILCRSSAWRIQLYYGWMDGALLWMPALAVFPRLKGRNNVSLFFLI
jgi:hypothetical protein